MTASIEKKPSRSERRRADTRLRLVNAAGELFAEKGVGNTRIAEIAERADVATGSFYNHFDDKEAIVEAVLAEVVEGQGSEIDRLTAEIEDPAEVVAFAHRHLIQLACSDPTFGQLILRMNASHRLLTEILGPRAVRDIRSGIDSRRFRVEDAVSASFTTGGALLGTISGVVDGSLKEHVAEIHVASILRLLGLSRAEAARIARHR